MAGKNLIPFGDRLRELIGDNTVAAFARKVRVDAEVIYKILRNPSVAPQLHTLENLAEGLQMSVERLVEGTTAQKREFIPPDITAYPPHKATSMEAHDAPSTYLGDDLCTLAGAPEIMLMPGWTTIASEKVSLTYDPKAKKYKPDEHKGVAEIFNAWKKANPKEFAKLDDEPWGKRVRIEKVEWSDSPYGYVIHLSPCKFLFYEGVHAQLEREEYSGLVPEFIEEMSQLAEGRRPRLPCLFGAHVIVISADDKILVQKRGKGTKIFPNQWEAPIGEFIHGPASTEFGHFKKRNVEPLSDFLMDAVTEELAIPKESCKAEDFDVLGWPIERSIIHPTPIAAYYSRLSFKELINPTEQPKDKAAEYDWIKFSAQGIGAALTRRDRNWRPLARVNCALALLHKRENGKVPVLTTERRKETLRNLRRYMR